MSVMWKGPSEAVIASRSDPIARQLHRRAAKQNIAYNLSSDGLSGEVFTVHRKGFSMAYETKRIAVVFGADPLNVFVNIALEYTEHDHELFHLMAALIHRRTEQFIDAENEVKRHIERAADTLADIHRTMR